MPTRLCSLVDCGRPHEAHGWCSSHYHRWLRWGSPLIVKSGGSPADRFWSKVDKDGPIPIHRPKLGPCWIWTATTSRGYGQFWRRKDNGGTVAAHRYAYELLVGTIPDYLTLDHLCHNDSGCRGGETCIHRACVNPAHLEPVSIGVNALRGTSFAANNARKTHCIRGHEFTPDNIYTNPSQPRGRFCITCRRDAGRDNRRRNQLNRSS
jgi:hypothetical protein